ncbi:MAG: cysteine--tRNA ligase [Thermoguttaceae bacterium]|nr:cysteine--tRNA ligase [Thermoguttaceae bacterium]MBQ9873019.1 cysteine--tRNA ligase [Thermoguttaceae bacterium]
MLRVFNTLSRTKEEFRPVTPNKVGMYLCGPTVYKPSHIGHMVGPTIFDAIKRYLTYSGYETTWVVNITDVDDKLIAESKARGIPMAAVASEMTEDYKNNLAAMGVDGIDYFPKATDYIGEIIQFTSDLIEKGFAYESEGDVYFDVAKFPEYGKLSNRTLEQMSGEGGGTADRKRSNFDFALWKSAKPGEPSWDSPWGKGRPGWHIECSVMSCSLLGETFDIHGGGLDLQFPHHENEIAQSEARNGVPMAKFWMHNGLMQASNEVGKVGGRKTREAESEAKEGDLASQEAGKISKSKGASAFRDLLKKFKPENIRFFLLSTHYRRPIDYSEERLQEVGKGLESFYRYFKRFESVTGKSFYDLQAAKTRVEGDEFEKKLPDFDGFGAQVKGFRAKFLDAMDDDFNTAGGVAVLFDFLRALNKFVETNKLEGTAPTESADAREGLVVATTIFRELAAALGLFRAPIPEDEAKTDALVDPLMNLIIDLRRAAKKNKDFATADQIRDRLKELGITLEDRPGGVCVWNKE